MTAVLLLYLALGLALGGAYFALMWRGVRLQAEQAAPVWIVLHAVLRLAGAGLVLWLVAQAGAWPLLATFAGFLLARVGATRLARRIP
jgi:hypothetical protein